MLEQLQGSSYRPGNSSQMGNPDQLKRITFTLK